MLLSEAQYRACLPVLPFPGCSDHLHVLAHVPFVHLQSWVTPHLQEPLLMTLIFFPIIFFLSLLRLPPFL